MDLFFESFGYSCFEYSAIRKMMILSCQKHKKQERKYSKLDYFFHPVDVMMFVNNVIKIKDEDILCVCLGHDLLEDTDCKEQEILDASNENVLFDIKCLTREDIKDKTVRSAMLVEKCRSFSNRQKIVKCADRIVNLNDAFYEFPKQSLLLYVRESLNIINAMNENIDDDKHEKDVIRSISYLEEFCNLIIKEKGLGDNNCN